MSEFHYVRTLGVDGGVDAVEGPAVGLDLESILKDGLPPFKVALEILAALCEILDIADQDGEVHGDITPRYVFVDETGAVSLEGFGTKRAKTLAPEGAPKGSATDLFGLGYCAYRMFTPNELPQLPAEPDAHDDGIIDAIISVNFEGLPEEIIGDIQWFIAKLLSFDREDRPEPVDVWRTFIAFADAVAGPRLDDWSSQAITGGGERRDKQQAAKKPEPPKTAAEPEEDLGGPVMQKGPLAKGGISFDGGGKKGQATAFWSRDQMKAALDAEEDGEEADGFRPQKGGGSATSFWSKDQMQAMSEGRQDAPRPKRKPGGKAATSFMERPQKARDEDDSAPKPPPKAPPPPSPGSKSGPGVMPPPSAKQGPSAPPPVAPPPVAKQPAAPPPVAAPPPATAPGQSPFAQGPQSPPPAYADPEPEPAKGGGMGMIVGVVVILLLLVCGGVVVLGGGGAAVAMLSGGSTGAGTVTPPDEPKVETPKDDAPKDDGSSTSSSTSSSSTDAGSKDDGSKSSTSSSSTSSKDGGSKTSSGSSTSSTSSKSSTSSSSGTSSKSSTSSGSSSSGTSSKSSTSSTPTTTSTTTSSGSSVRPKSGDATTTTTTAAPTTTTTSTTSSSVRPKSGTTTTAAPPPTDGPVKVTVKSSGRGKLSCTDGQTPSFDGSTTLEFEGYNLPVTCMVTIDGKRGAFTADRGGTYTCNNTGSEVSCN